MKTCSRCGGDKPLGDFHARKDRPSGVQAHCKTCEAERQRSRRDEMRNYQRQWREQNPDREKEYSARFRERNRERIRIDARIRVPSDRARKLGLFVEDIDPAVVFERDRGCCGICGDQVDLVRFDIDHVMPLTLGGLHAYANVQVAHPTCNKRKHNQPPPSEE